MITGAVFLALVAVAPSQGQQSPGADRIRVLAEQGGGDQSPLLEAVRQSPNDTRTALAQLFERWAAPGSRVDVEGHAAAAKELALAYSEAWRDSFLLKQVALFESWSPRQRRTKVSADSLRKSGNQALGHSGIDAAMKEWRSGLRRSTLLADTIGMAATLGNLGAGFYHAGVPDSAEAYLEQSRKLAEALGDRRTALNALGTLGTIAKESGDLRRARALYTRALSLRELIGDYRGMAADRNNLGLLAEQLGDRDGAEQSYRAALSESRRHHLEEPEAAALTNLGNLASLEGDFGRANSYYRAALSIYRDGANRFDAALVLQNLGTLALRRGDYSGARDWLTQALDIYRETGPPASAVEVHRILSRTLSAMGDLQSALAQLHAAEEIVTGESEDPHMLATLAMARADLATDFNSFDEADRQYHRAEALFQRADDAVGVAQAQEGIGFLHLVREDYPQAQIALELAARTYQVLGLKRSAALSRMLLGHVHLARADTAAAALAFRGSADSLHALGDVVGKAAALAGLGDVATRSGKWLVAEAFYRRGLDALGTAPSPAIAWRLHAGLGEALQGRGALAEAADALGAAVVEVERVAGLVAVEERRAAYLADKWGVYAELAALEQRRGRDRAAYEVSERMRGRQMLDLLARGRLAAGANNAGESLAAREQDLRRSIGELMVTLGEVEGRPELRGAAGPGERSASLLEELNAAQQAYADILLRVREERPEYAALVTGQLASASEVAAQLPADAALLEYLISDSTALLFVVTSEGIRAFDLNVSRRTLASQIDFVRSVLGPPGQAPAGDAWRAPLRRLYRYLIEPAQQAGLLTEKRRLLIAPHAELHYLPFSALIATGAPDEFLIERFDVSYIPSGSVWARLRERPLPGAGGKILALAPKAATLPGSREEVEAIRRIYADRATVLVDAAASEAALRSASSRYDIIHLATYGVLNKHNPLFSFLELEPGGVDDGRLEVHEVFGLPLNARLVVLSACQTGVGSGALADVPAGDDWVGLVRAFLFANASMVAATLWPVEDRATARLMEDFYRSLSLGRSEVEALARAQRAALRNPRTAHPFFWAPFVLVGGS